MAKKEVKKDFDITAKVKMIATKTAPHHEEGEEFECHPNIAHNVFKKKGYAKFADPKDEADLSEVNEVTLEKLSEVAQGKAK